jgi:hypothetical protein
MTNAVGYYYNEREERVARNHEEFLNNHDRQFRPFESTFDINRDFPYNQANNRDCFNTIAARIVNELFVENLFVSAITFHGGVAELGYPWGSYNHVEQKGYKYISKEAPDYNAFDYIGRIMKNEAGH